ncbi:MAG: hypothetical protein V2B18_12345 [Pseudomonadota bacterium]
MTNISSYEIQGMENDPTTTFAGAGRLEPAGAPGRHAFSNHSLTGRKFQSQRGAGFLACEFSYCDLGRLESLAHKSEWLHAFSIEILTKCSR